ncbi:NmrA family protein [Kribbella flavida DSM 17836]|uniref:NmrA family protein n=1 Tax=Kribbella flavida (strain DSM 17836 / JCM 10339 / NBRC 14399) TaxID=479435 RepID=D2PP92_KRIFD|nr:NAD(P)H-binding protein [Kribbella flavida]ADB34688.1 NmrA family protein [Kribbella flavida DSM 17836]
MTARILVTGGTGTLGQLVVPRLTQAARDVRVLSRSAREIDGVEVVVGDLATGQGVDKAFDGVEVVVHCAGSAKGDDEKARQVVKAAVPAGVRHIVNVSVVGADTLPVVSGLDRAMFGYFAAKRGAEVAIEQAGVGWSNLRATQFHDLAFSVAEQVAKSPVVPAPSGFKVQPVDPAAVADRLVELALGTPQGQVADVAGPRTYTFKEMVGIYLRAAGKRRLMLPLWMPGQAAAAYRAGANLSSGQGTGRSWEEFVAAKVAR